MGRRSLHRGPVVICSRGEGSVLCPRFVRAHANLHVGARCRYKYASLSVGIASYTRIVTLDRLFGSSLLSRSDQRERVPLRRN